MTRPSKPAEWADSSTNIVEPTSGRKLQGWDIGQVPSSGNQNWWQNEVFQWLQYLDASFGTITGATTTLTADSDDIQICSGSTDKTIKLPDETTLAVGRRFRFIVTGTGTVVIKDSSTATLETLSALASGQRTLFADFVSTSASFSANHWYWQYNKPGQIFGTTTNDSAAAGFIGELIGPSGLHSSAAVTVTPSASAVNLGTITLTPGDWDVQAAASLSGGTDVFFMSAGVSAASGTGFPSASLNNFPSSSSGEMFVSGGVNVAGGATNQLQSLVIPAYRVVVLTGTTKQLWFNASATWNTTAPIAWGSIWARRAR